MISPALANFRWKLTIVPTNLIPFILFPNKTFKDFLKKGAILRTIKNKKRTLKDLKFDWSIVESVRAQNPKK